MAELERMDLSAKKLLYNINFMVKHLHSVLIFVLGFFSVAASAQGPAAVTKPNDGYYRIVNARQRTDGKQYVFVTGKIAAQPNANHIAWYSYSPQDGYKQN